MNSEGINLLFNILFVVLPLVAYRHGHLKGVEDGALGLWQVLWDGGEHAGVGKKRVMLHSGDIEFEEDE